MTGKDIPERSQSGTLLELGASDWLGRLAVKAGMVDALNMGSGSCVYSHGCDGVTQEHLNRFAELVLAAELALKVDELEALRTDAERYRKLCDVPGALDAFTAAYHNTQTKAQIDAAVDATPVVGSA